MSFSPLTIIIILVLGVLFFGKNLPEVARQIGSALLEFRKGVDEWKELGAKAVNTRATENSRAGGGGSSVVGEKAEEMPEHFESLGTKFEPPEG